MGHVLNQDEMDVAVATAREAGLSIAFANGCFDLLHVGHVRYLKGAAFEADLLIVGINADSSVRAIKGESRPIQPEEERAEIVAAIGGVDVAVIFDEETVEPLLRRVKPDVHCKGTDYTPETVPERHVMAELGGRIAIVGDPKDHDSSALIAKLAKRED